MVILDHAPTPGRKILISGGGRANFTHLDTTAEHFLSENPHFAKSALASYSPQQFVQLVASYGIAYHEKAPGQLFCNGSARELLDMLLAECREADFLLSTELICAEKTEEGFLLTTKRSGAHSEQTSALRSHALVVATGGLSIPKLGATGLGYQLAHQFGLRVVPARPALVPLVVSPSGATGGGDLIANLSGTATEAEIAVLVQPSARRGEGHRMQAREVRFRDKLLITHRGLSGPAALQISSYWRPGEPLSLDFAPQQMIIAPFLREPIRRSHPSLLQALASAMPRRLAERLLQLAPVNEWTNEALLGFERRIHCWPINPEGTEGFEKAEVTAGGVSTAELNARTLEARKVPGLFFIGEVVDVTGQLGGLNFQWAWASAAAAARALAGSCTRRWTSRSEPQGLPSGRETA